MYESRHQPPVPLRRFVRRLLRHGAAAGVLVVLSMLAGMAGYSYFEGLAWRDGFLNAAMLLGGMGPVDPPHTDGGKLFEGLYALYAGLVLMFVAGLLLSPVFHRIIHKFHWDQGSK